MSPRKLRAKNEKYRLSGALIATRRGELELTQEELAARIGVKRQNVQHWEKGAAMPRPEKMERLAEELGLTLDEIARGERGQGGPDSQPQQHGVAPTSNALTVARIWDNLPQSGQEYIAEQLAAMLRFQDEDRDMAAYVFTTPSATAMKRLKEHEKKLETIQEQKRRNLIETRDDDSDA